MKDVSYHPGVQPLTVAPTFEGLTVRVSDNQIKAAEDDHLIHKRKASEQKRVRRMAKVNWVKPQPTSESWLEVVGPRSSSPDLRDHPTNG